MQTNQLAVRLVLQLRLCQYFHHNKILWCFLLRWKCLPCTENFYISPVSLLEIKNEAVQRT